MDNLSVPFCDQRNNGVWNDCGEASNVMVAGSRGIFVTIKQMQDAMDRVGITDDLDDLARGLDNYNIETKEYWGMGIPDLAELLKEGKPVICLIDYAKVPAYAKSDPYKGLHFVVLVGMNDKVHYHDPLHGPDVAVKKTEWHNFFTGRALAPTVGVLPIINGDEVTEETAKELIGKVTELKDAIQLSNLIALVSGDVVITKGEDPGCYMTKGTRKIDVTDWQDIINGLSPGGAILNQ